MCVYVQTALYPLSKIVLLAISTLWGTWGRTRDQFSRLPWSISRSWKWTRTEKSIWRRSRDFKNTKTRNYSWSYRYSKKYTKFHVKSLDTFLLLWYSKQQKYSHLFSSKYFQEYEKQMKAFGINMNSSPAGKKRSAPSMLESPYSKTFIFAPHSKDMEVKEVNKELFITIIEKNYDSLHVRKSYINFLHQHPQDHPTCYCSSVLSTSSLIVCAKTALLTYLVPGDRDDRATRSFL